MSHLTRHLPFIPGLTGRVGFLAWTLSCVLSVSYVSAIFITWAVGA